MRVVVQRVTMASCTISCQKISEIGTGFLLLVAFAVDDEETDIAYMVKKISGLRIFSDQNGQMNLNLKSVNGKILSISQFTLYGSVKEGNRPSFTESMNYEKAKKFYLSFNLQLREAGFEVFEGEFGADMSISLINDGPVTIIIDSKEKK